MAEAAEDLLAPIGYEDPAKAQEKDYEVGTRAFSEGAHIRGMSLIDSHLSLTTVLMAYNPDQNELATRLFFEGNNGKNQFESGVDINLAAKAITVKGILPDENGTELIATPFDIDDDGQADQTSIILSYTQTDPLQILNILKDKGVLSTTQFEAAKDLAGELLEIRALDPDYNLGSGLNSDSTPSSNPAFGTVPGTVL